MRDKIRGRNREGEAGISGWREIKESADTGEGDEEGKRREWG